MLESLADFDDALLEQLLEDKIPAPEEIFEHFTKDLGDDLIVPVLLGSAEQGNGIQRLFKALRHDAPGPDKTAERLGVPEGEGFVASIVKTLYQAHSGKLSVARIWRGTLKDNSVLGEDRLSGVNRMLGGEFHSQPKAEAGELVGLSRLEAAQTGQILTDKGPQDRGDMLWPETLKPVYAMAVEPKNRQDEVKLTAAIGKLTEEDPSIAMEQQADTHQLLLWGQGEIHLKLAAERLKSRFNVDVTLSPPRTAYKETITKSVKQHARHKKQSGGHGQFGDVQVEIKPLPRGSGFEFTNSIVGGAIPKQYIPSVENGIKEYLVRGPLGFPVVDVAVNLFDGQYHSVDSSDQAFKTAGRQAMAEGMPNCAPILLEPIFKVTISVPTTFTSGIHGLISGRRGQILGFEAKPGWEGWDDLNCYLPQAELADLIVEIRSLTLGVGTFDAEYDRLQELTGKIADRVIAEAQQQAAQ
jgi:elongation factor G